MSNIKETRISGPGVGRGRIVAHEDRTVSAAPDVDIRASPDTVICGGGGGGGFKEAPPGVVIHEVRTVGGGGGGAGAHVGPSQLSGHAADYDRLHEKKMKQIERDLVLAEASLHHEEIDANRVTVQLTEAIRSAVGVRESAFHVLELLDGPLGEPDLARKSPASITDQVALLREELDEAHRLLARSLAAI